MKGKIAIRNWILKNCVNDYGNIDLSNLDFSQFEGNIRISGMQVKKTLEQDHHIVGQSIFQGGHRVHIDIWQDNQKAHLVVQNIKKKNKLG